MSKTLEEIRRKLQALDSRKGQQGTGAGDKATYLHWNIAEGTSCVLRFLPDANEDNTFFWAERQTIKLPFPGIKGQDEHKPVIVQVPCIEMWDGPKTCPILNEVRPWWKDKSLEDTARKYWCKRTYYMQGFVKQDPMKDVTPPENPIRKFIMGPQLFAIIKAALLDPDLVYSPVNYINGLDFTIIKTAKGGFADYGTSKWARKETSITEEMQAAIDQYKLVDLATYLPKRPNAEQLDAIYNMFLASVDGEMYDPALWSQYYKPFGFDSATDDDEAGESTPTRTTFQASARPVVTKTLADAVAMAEESFEVKTPVVETIDAPVASATVGKKTPQEILAMLKNRPA